MCDLVNHTHFPEEDHLPDWARRDNKDTKGDRADYVNNSLTPIHIADSPWVT